MSGFLYFFPLDSEVVSEGELTLAALRKLHLDKVLADCLSFPAYTIHKCRGPDSAEGHVVYPVPVGNTPPKPKTYRPDKQGWQDRGGFYLGWENGNPPTEEDLTRGTRAGGYVLEDRHGQSWIIPIIRSEYQRETLSMDYTFDAECNLKTVVKREYQQLWEDIGKALDYFVAIEDQQPMDEIQKEWPNEWLVKLAIQCLTVNYRLGIHEVAGLAQIRPIMDPEFSAAVLTAATDWRHVQSMRAHLSKKKDPLAA